MKFSIPKSFPTSTDFFNEIQRAIIPELGESASPSDYANANKQSAIKLGLLTKLGDYNEDVAQDSDYLRLIYVLTKYCPILKRENKNVLENMVLKFTDFNAFCEAGTKTLRNWLTKNSTTTKDIECAVFYTLLLLGREECKANVEPFFKKCLKYIGITDLNAAECLTLFNFDWNEIKIEPGFENKPYAWLSNKAIECLGLTLFAIFSLVGDDLKVVKEILPLVHKAFIGLFEKESKISASMDAAENALWSSIKYFVPRSIQTSDPEMYPQDFFVMPVFKKDQKVVDSPFSEINGAEHSKRSMIVAKTGMGKSLFLQMAAICMLNGKHGMPNSKIDAFSKSIAAPSGFYIIYVPAKMFSYCYNKTEYKSWTSDFIRLYFNCMWRLSSTVNFYSTNDSQRYGSADVGKYSLNDEEFELLEKVICEYARSGKLILLLDSFDEIAPGNMRTAYFQALSSFYDNYCEYPEQVGAHVVLVSREMSKETMRSVEARLNIHSEHDASYVYRICDLNPEQRRTLITNWDKFKNIDYNETLEKISLIESNHCYCDFAVNPYMLSVVCFSFDRSLGDISGSYIDFLVSNMQQKNRNESDEIQQVLAEITDTLQDVANSTISTGNPHFAKGKLTKNIKEKLDSSKLNKNLSETDKERIIDKIHEIIVVSVGLIVPADGKDDAYQFINDQIRYELAAKKIRSNIQDQNNSTLYYVDGILPAISSIRDYVGVLVPMICAIDLEDPQLSQVLVLDLLMRKSCNDNESNDENLLIRAMIDLLLGRYGSNIITCATPGAVDELYVRQAQRMLLMRIFTSPAFNPTADEKEEIKASAALTSNIAYFSERILDILN